jgi:hypothetical protein
VAIRLVKDDRVYDTCLVTLELHAETLQFLDREGAVLVRDKKIGRLARRRQRDPPVGVQRTTCLIGPFWYVLAQDSRNAGSSTSPPAMRPNTMSATSGSNGADRRLILPSRS